MKPVAKDYLMVGIQGLIFILYLLDLSILSLKFPYAIRLTALIFSISGGLIVVISLLQLNRNLSPFPTPKAGSELIQNGIYKFVRHPIYSGILLGLGSFAIYTLSGYRIILTIILYVLFEIKSSYEEKLLIKQYPEYSDYQKRTGRFIPRL